MRECFNLTVFKTYHQINHLHWKPTTYIVKLSKKESKNLSPGRWNTVSFPFRCSLVLMA